MVLPEAGLDLSRPGLRRRVVLCLLAACSVMGGPLAAQVDPPGPGPYDPAVPRPAAVRGFATGTDFTPAAKVVETLERIAAASPRVLLQRYGRTVEGRPLVLVWVSAPGNLARLAELRAANVRLFHAGGDAPVADDHPLFVWFAFGVHGDEPAGPEAALELVYHLAAARDPATAARLERVVVVVDPLQNPDGHARHLRWYRSVAGPEPDPSPRAAEHRPGWPSGRTNGLHFDLNRDWAWGVMPETRARWKAYLATLPQVFVDFHEMEPSPSYFFFPPADPVHPLLPASTLAWARVFGEANARAFARRGWAWHTGRDFDLVYPGYGDAWTSFHGATGMTYEQGGGGRAGILLAGKGGVLSLADRIAHHLGAAIATLDAAATRSRERLADFAGFWRPGTVPADVPAFYLVPPAAGSEALAGRLAAQGVIVETTSAPVDAARVVPLGPGRAPAGSLPAGTLSVATDQPFGRYAAALMDPRPAVREATSDIASWSLPHLHDLPVFASRPGIDPPRVAWRPRTRTPGTPGPPEPMAEPTVLAWSYESVGDVLAAVGLAARGESVFVADRRLVPGGRSDSHASFVAPIGRERMGRAARLLAELTRRGVEPRPMRIHLPAEGLRPVRAPRVALLGDSLVLETSLGAVRHLLARAGVAVDQVALEQLDGEELEAYDVVVLPDGADFDGYARRLRPRIGRLEAWVAAGGTLVAVRGGAAALAMEAAGGLEPPAATGYRGRGGVGRGRAGDLRQGGAPGILVAARIEPREILGQGFADGEAMVMAWDPVLLEDSEGEVTWRFGEAPTRDRRRFAPVAGLTGRPYALLRAHGAGHLVLFADDPGFRGMLPALSKLYLNALVLLAGRGAPPAAGGP